jgi:hypothetical protein
MRVGPIAHGALLVAALGFAYQTWTREKTETPKVGTVAVWSEAVEDFEAFAYDGEDKSLRVERRNEGGEAYYWGQVTRTEKKKKPKVPVKGAPGDTAGGQVIDGEDDGHGHGPGGHGRPTPPRPGAAPGATPPGAIPGKPPTPGAAPSKAEPSKAEPSKAEPSKAEPSKAGGGPGPKTPQARSPHHAGAGQGEPEAPKPGGATPAKPGDKPGAAPGKPDDKSAGGAAPAKPGAGGSSGPAGEPAPEGEGEEAEGEGEPAAEPAPEPEETTSKTKEFPVGKLGQELINNLASLKALRDLGTLTDKQKEEYELAESKENLTVFFKGGKKHSLIIGSRVFGGGDRYVMNPDNGRGYVLSNSEIMRHIDGAESALAPRGLHEFQDEIPPSSVTSPDEDHNLPKARRDRYPGVSEVQVEADGNTHAWTRYEQPDPANGTTITGWADKKKPGESDVGFSNFLTQVERLRPLEYNVDVDVATLSKVMTVRYMKSDGKSIGTFELYKKGPSVTPEVEPSEESKKNNETAYYVKTELTRVPGKVGRMSAERVADDLPQLFGAPAKPKDDKAGDKAGNPHGKTPDKTEPAKGAEAPAKAGSPAEPAAPKPAGSKPNPTEGNK